MWDETKKVSEHKSLCTELRWSNALSKSDSKAFYCLRSPKFHLQKLNVSGSQRQRSQIERQNLCQIEGENVCQI